MSTSYFAGPFEQPDRYQLSELRSRGGEGELWVGWITVDGQQLPVAVKVFHPSAGLSITDLHERVRSQAEILRSLEHPNLVKVREVFLGPPIHATGMADPNSTSLYMIMNWVDGENLTSWVARNQTRDPLQCTRIVSRVAAAVDELHSGRHTGGVPVLHRDIKPSNVIVNGEDVRLVDFGLTRFATSEYETIAGSTSYIAPEVLAGARPTEAADRFALGATAYYLFTGANPDHNNPGEMRAQLQRVPGIADTDGFTNHLMALMDRDLSRRPANVQEWAQGLAVGAVSQTFTQPIKATGGVGAAAETKKRKRLPVFALLAVIALVIVGGLAFFLTRSDDTATAAVETTESSTTTEPTTTTESTTTTTEPTTTTESTTTTSTSLPDSPGEIDAPEGIQYLADFKEVDSSANSLSHGQGNLSGVTYTRSILMEPNTGQMAFAEYNLGRKYKTLEMSTGLEDNSYSAAQVKIQIYADGRVLFDKTVSLGDSLPVKLDVSNVLRLRLQLTDISGEYGSEFVVFADPNLSAE